MADIDVVPKRKTNVWIWIVLAIVVLAVLWMMLGGRNTARTGRLGSAVPPMFTADILDGFRASHV
jgi:hypothetical protein